jgi:hypothetical protein
MNGACPCDTPLESKENNSCHDCGTTFCRGCLIELSSNTYCHSCAAASAAPR